MLSAASINGWSRTVLFGAVGLCMGFNWAALQLVAWTGMTVQNARTMDWDTAMEHAVAGQQSCMICRLIDDRQGAEEAEGKAIVFQGVEIKGVLHTTAILVSRPQDKLQQVEHFNPPLTLHTAPQPPPPESAA